MWHPTNRLTCHVGEGFLWVVAIMHDLQGHAVLYRSDYVEKMATVLVAVVDPDKDGMVVTSETQVGFHGYGVVGCERGHCDSFSPICGWALVNEVLSPFLIYQLRKKNQLLIHFHHQRLTHHPTLCDTRYL